jgi:hypothetical protein
MNNKLLTTFEHSMRLCGEINRFRAPQLHGYRPFVA